MVGLDSSRDVLVALVLAGTVFPGCATIQEGRRTERRPISSHEVIERSARPRVHDCQQTGNEVQCSLKSSTTCTPLTVTRYQEVTHVQRSVRSDDLRYVISVGIVGALLAGAGVWMVVDSEGIAESRNLARPEDEQVSPGSVVVGGIAFSTLGAALLAWPATEFYRARDTTVFGRDLEASERGVASQCAEETALPNTVVTMTTWEGAKVQGTTDASGLVRLALPANPRPPNDQRTPWGRIQTSRSEPFAFTPRYAAEQPAAEKAGHAEVRVGEGDRPLEPAWGSNRDAQEANAQPGDLPTDAGAFNPKDTLAQSLVVESASSAELLQHMEKLCARVSDKERHLNGPRVFDVPVQATLADLACGTPRVVERCRDLVQGPIEVSQSSIDRSYPRQRNTGRLATISCDGPQGTIIDFAISTGAILQISLGVGELDVDWKALLRRMTRIYGKPRRIGRVAFPLSADRYGDSFEIPIRGVGRIVYEMTDDPGYPRDLYLHRFTFRNETAIKKAFGRAHRARQKVEEQRARRVKL